MESLDFYFEQTFYMLIHFPLMEQCVAGANTFVKSMMICKNAHDSS